VDEGRGLEGVSVALSGHVAGGDGAEPTVHETEQGPEIRGIASLGGTEDPRDFPGVRLPAHGAIISGRRSTRQWEISATGSRVGKRRGRGLGPYAAVRATLARAASRGWRRPGASSHWMSTSGAASM
jgi:hypothetical protein